MEELASEPNMYPDKGKNEGKSLQKWKELSKSDTFNWDLYYREYDPKTGQK